MLFSDMLVGGTMFDIAGLLVLVQFEGLSGLKILVSLQLQHFFARLSCRWSQVFLCGVQSVAAIEVLNGKHKIEGSSVPLVVKWADTKKGRLEKHKKLNFHRLICQMQMPCNRVHYSVLYRWDMCLRIMDLAISHKEPMDLCSTLCLRCKTKQASRIWFNLSIKEVQCATLILNYPLIQFLGHSIQCSWAALIQLHMVCSILDHVLVAASIVVLT